MRKTLQLSDSARFERIYPPIIVDNFKISGDKLMKSSDRARISYISRFISTGHSKIRIRWIRVSFMHPRVYTCLHARDIFCSHTRVHGHHGCAHRECTHHRCTYTGWSLTAAWNVVVVALNSPL